MPYTPLSMSQKMSMLKDIYNVRQSREQQAARQKNAEITAGNKRIEAENKRNAELAQRQGNLVSQYGTQAIMDAGAIKDNKWVDNYNLNQLEYNLRQGTKPQKSPAEIEAERLRQNRILIEEQGKAAQIKNEPLTDAEKKALNIEPEDPQVLQGTVAKNVTDIAGLMAKRDELFDDGGELVGLSPKEKRAFDYQIGELERKAKNTLKKMYSGADDEEIDARWNMEMYELTGEEKYKNNVIDFQNKMNEEESAKTQPHEYMLNKPKKEVPFIEQAKDFDFGNPQDAYNQVVAPTVPEEVQTIDKQAPIEESIVPKTEKKPVDTKTDVPEVDKDGMVEVTLRTGQKIKVPKKEYDRRQKIIANRKAQADYDQKLLDENPNRGKAGLTGNELVRAKEIEKSDNLWKQYFGNETVESINAKWDSLSKDEQDKYGKLLEEYTKAVNQEK